MATINKGMLRKVLRTMGMDSAIYVQHICHLLEGGEPQLKEVPEKETYTAWGDIESCIQGVDKEDLLNNMSEEIDKTLSSVGIKPEDITGISYDCMDQELEIKYLKPTPELTKLSIEEGNIKITKVLDSFDKIKSLYLAELSKYNMDEKSQIEQQIKELQTKLEDLNND